MKSSASATPTKRVSIVIPNWNGADWLGQCVKALEQQTLTDFELILVDNGSTDGSEALAQSRAFPTRLIKLDRNYLFAIAVNRGIKASAAEYVVLLNNDTEPEPGWLSTLVAAMDDQPEYGFAASKMLHFEDRTKINTAGDGYSVYGLPFARWSDQTDGPQYDQAGPVFSASGGAAIYRRSMLDKIGLLDERFLIYCEDLDLSFRARLAGYSCLFVPTARVYHHVGATSRRISGFGHYYTTRNFLMLLVKDLPGPLWRKHWRKIIMGQIIWFLSGRSPKRTYYSLKAYLGFLTVLPYCLRERKRIQDGAKVPASEIERLMLPCFSYDSSLVRIFKKLHLVVC
jgi:GT2 family glycosyltransferase